LTSTAGHELVHKKEWINKFIGNLPYILFLYSHFFSEHVHSHHKDLATSKDAASHELGVSSYYAMFRATYKSHYNSWIREK